MRLHDLPTSSLLIVAGLVGVANRGSAQCLDWKSGFGIPGPSNTVSALGVFDDGSGPALYALGVFTSVDGIPANRIAKWNGSTWSALGDGLSGGGNPYASRAIAVFNDGAGAALFVGGDFTTAGSVSAHNITKWDGSTWSALGTGMDNTVSALAVFDDGTGPALYAGGPFTTAGGTSVNHIAKWDGASWSPVGTGLDGGASAFAAFDDGTGSALYAAGSDVYRWNGSTWSPVGTGLGGGAQALLVFDDGTGFALYAGGNGVSKWDGSTWSHVGVGSPTPIYSFAALNDGSGPLLFASSNREIGRWDGVSWSALQMSDWPTETINALAVFDDGAGPALFAGTEQGHSDRLSLYLGRWNGSNWIPVGNTNGMIDDVSCLAVIDNGSGPAIYAGGYFHAAGGVAASHIARLDGLHWSALGGGIEGGQQYHETSVNAVAAFDDGAGPAIYAGGAFSSAGGEPANNIGKWNGSTWTPLGRGLDGSVTAMCVFDDGTGAALYVGGTFSTAGGTNVGGIAKWNGSSWSPVGTGMGGGARAMLVFDDGTGPALYAGGNGVTKWDGSAWSQLGTGSTFSVAALAVFDDGTGPALYADGVSRWNGSSWVTLWSGLPINLCLSGLTVFDDGYGPALYISGRDYCFLDTYIYKWRGSGWSYAAGTGGPITDMVVFQGLSDPAPGLYMSFGEVPHWHGTTFSGIAEWRGCGHPGETLCFGDGSTGACPCGNSGSPGHGCENSASTGGAILDSSGWTSLAFDSLTLTSYGVHPGGLSIFLQGTTESQPTVYGDGLRCTGGHLKRLFARAAGGSVVSAPLASEPSISARSAAKGDPLSVAASRLYQVFYRDPSTTFCPSPIGSTWNISNARRIQWLL